MKDYQIFTSAEEIRQTYIEWHRRVEAAPQSYSENHLQRGPEESGIISADFFMRLMQEMRERNS